MKADVQVMDSGASGCCLQWLHHHARTSWSAVQCTWTTALLAYGATASQIELGSSIRAEVHCSAYGIIEYYA